VGPVRAGRRSRVGPSWLGCLTPRKYIQSAVTENAWADAVLLVPGVVWTGIGRRWRRAAVRFEGIGATFEHVHTLSLLTDR